MSERTEILDVLKAARNIISDPEHWTQGEFARTANGEDVEADDEKAVCWCLEGAFDRVTMEMPVRHAVNVRRTIRRLLMGRITQDRLMNLAQWNDSHAHADVLALLDGAIESMNQ